MSIRGEEVANRFLLALPAQVFGQLEPHLKTVGLRRGQTLSRPGRPLDQHLFINRGLVSLIKTMRDGRTV